jgi:hypothetical protein
MAQLSSLDFEADLDARPDNREVVQAWRAEQLRRHGLPPAFADAFADFVDWHDFAALVGRGCSPMLALEIVR